MCAIAAHDRDSSKWLAEMTAHAPRMATSVIIYFVSVASTIFGTVTLNDQLLDFDVTIGYATTAGGLIGILVIPPTFMLGLVLRRVEPRRVVAFACALIASILFVGSYLHNAFVRFYILGLFGIPAVVGTQQTVHTVYHASWLSGTSLPSALALLNSGYSIAGMVVPLTVAPLVETFGWRNVSRYVFAPVVMFNALCANQLLILNQSKISHADDAGVQDDQQGMTVADAKKTRRFYLHYVATTLIMVYEGVAISQFMLLFQREGGCTITEAARFYSTQYACAIVGKVLCSALLPLVPRAPLLLSVPAAFCASHFLLLDMSAVSSILSEGSALTALWSALRFEKDAAIPITHSQWQLFLFSVVYGLSFGCTHSLYVSQPCALFGKRALGTFQSIHWGFNMLGGVAGTSTVGILHDFVGSYSPIGGAMQMTLISTALVYVCSILLAYDIATGVSGPPGHGAGKRGSLGSASAMYYDSDRDDITSSPSLRARGGYALAVPIHLPVGLVGRTEARMGVGGAVAWNELPLL